jgi:hypothetical protein
MQIIVDLLVTAFTLQHSKKSAARNLTPNLALLERILSSPPSSDTKDQNIPFDLPLRNQVQAQLASISLWHFRLVATATAKIRCCSQWYISLDPAQKATGQQQPVH